MDPRAFVTRMILRLYFNFLQWSAINCIATTSAEMAIDCQVHPGFVESFFLTISVIGVAHVDLLTQFPELRHVDSAANQLMRP